MQSHGGLGAGVAQAHLLQARHPRAQQLRHLDFQLGRRAVADADLRLLQNRIAHQRVLVAQDHRPPGADVIDIALAIGILQPGAVRRGDEARHAADGAERAHRRVHAARNAELGAVEELFGTIHEQRFPVMTPAAP
jgi:hypothetical protein